MTLQECKVGAKVWYYPCLADKTKRKKGTIYTAPAYMWGDWALEEVQTFLEHINLNEFIIGKISLDATGIKHCQLEFDKNFIYLMLVAIKYGIDVRHLSPVERMDLLNKNLVL